MNHRQQRADDRHAGIEQAQAVDGAAGCAGARREGDEGHDGAPLSNPATAKPSFTIHQ